MLHPEKTLTEIADKTAGSRRFYLIPDYEEDSDADLIVKSFGNLSCLTGGSGLLASLASHMLKDKSQQKIVRYETKGKGILLAGSCSKATLSQIAWYKNKGGLAYKIDPKAILEGRQKLKDIEEFISRHNDENILIYSSETPAYLEAIRGETLEQYSVALENMMAAIASMVRDNNFTRIIVAGGETSGAVTKALGYNGYWIGPSVAPGVPVMVPYQKPNLRLVLKSGNFGNEDFFEKALKMTEEEETDDN